MKVFRKVQYLCPAVVQGAPSPRTMDSLLAAAALQAFLLLYFCIFQSLGIFLFSLSYLIPRALQQSMFETLVFQRLLKVFLFFLIMSGSLYKQEIVKTENKVAIYIFEIAAYYLQSVSMTEISPYFI